MGVGPDVGVPAVSPLTRDAVDSGVRAKAGVAMAVGVGIRVGEDRTHPAPMVARRARRLKIKHRFKFIFFLATGLIIWQFIYY